MDATTLTPQAYPYTNLHQMTLDAFNRPVAHVIVAVARGSHYPASNAELNHWRIFLLDASGRSVAFDMGKRSGTDFTGHLTVSSRPYGVSTSTVQEIHLYTGNVPFTAYQAWSQISAAGLLRYRYTQTGEGCRYWVRKAIQVLEAADYIPRSSLQTLGMFLQIVWREDGTTEIRPVAEGQVY